MNSNYKPSIPYNKARDMIAAESGKHFDPDLVSAFLEGFDEFVAIAEKHRVNNAITTLN